MKNRRRFNKGEHIDLFLAADGRCTNCGTQLPPNWHADHVVPYSKGGETVIYNGQALCPNCNQKKGNKTMKLAPWNKGLRAWQIEALEKFQSKNAANFLAVATPGAGKTTFALNVAHYLISSEVVNQVVVVCPTEALKKQWANAANAIGININPSYISGKFIVEPYHGVAVTYQQVSSSARLFLKLTTEEKTFVILDEPHHCGENRMWGDSVKESFQNCLHRLLITGTPFRTDNHPIPYVQYIDGVGQADSTYGYKDALRDGVCRYVMFPTYEGTMEWIGGGTGDHITANFAEKLNQREASERLNTAIDPDGDWIRQVVNDAHQRLLEMRANGHANAAGLIVTKDKKHAERMANVVKKITGVPATLVTSDTIEAETVIEKFAKGDEYWIIAIKMVSEGVDIPRLRVGIYATNVTAELFFRQFVGRFVRVILGLEEQVSCVFLPDDPEIVASAYAIAEERNHQLEEKYIPEPEYDDEYDDPRTGTTEKIPSLFVPISSEAIHSGAIVEDDRINVDEIQEAIALAREAQMPYVQPEVLANFTRLILAKHNQQSTASVQPTQPKTEKPLYRQIKRLKEEINALANRIAYARKIEVKDIHLDWVKLFNGKYHSADDYNDLVNKREWLIDQIKELGK